MIRRLSLLALLAAGPALADPAPLRVCLDEGIPPLSARRGAVGSGFDLEVARQVAGRLGRPLAVQWFESKADADSFPDREANALLSDGRCQLVGGYPLTADGLGEPRSPRAKLPDFAGARPEDRRRWVTLGALAPSRPYRRAALGLVAGPALAGRPVAHLAELAGLRLGVEERTLADAILTSYRDGMLLDQVRHVVAGPGLFEALARGETDAALVEIHRWDAWRAAHPDTTLTLNGYRHPIGVNAGFVGLAAEAELLTTVDAAIESLRTGDTLPGLAQAAGVTWVPPQAPAVRPPVRLAALRDD